MLPIDPAALVADVVPPLLWLLPPAAAAMLLRWWLPRRRGRAGERAVSRRLRHMFTDVADALVIPGDHGVLAQIDHLVLTPKGLLVIETRHHAGTILGHSQDAAWTQTIGRVCQRLQNPLRQNHAHARAVAALAPGVPVHARVVFLDDARFPKGLPPRVVLLSRLRQTLAPLSGGDIPPSYREGWELVLAQARTDRAGRKVRRQAARERRRIDAAQRRLARGRDGAPGTGRRTRCALRLGDLVRPLLLGLGGGGAVLWLLAALHPVPLKPGNVQATQPGLDAGAGASVVEPREVAAEPTAPPRPRAPAPRRPPLGVAASRDDAAPGNHGRETGCTGATACRPLPTGISAIQHNRPGGEDAGAVVPIAAQGARAHSRVLRSAADLYRGSE